MSSIYQFVRCNFFSTTVLFSQFDATHLFMTS